MKLVEINWNPPARQLRQFGLIALVALPLLGWLWSGGDLRIMVVLGGVGAALAVLGLAAPAVLRPVFIGLCLVTLPIGLVLSEAMLLAIFFGLFLPLGLLFRVIGRDALDRRVDRRATSYWRRKPQAPGAEWYFRQS